MMEVALKLFAQSPSNSELAKVCTVSICFPYVYMCILFVTFDNKAVARVIMALPHVLIIKSLMFTWVHTRRTAGPNRWLP